MSTRELDPGEYLWNENCNTMGLIRCDRYICSDSKKRNHVVSFVLGQPFTKLLVPLAFISL